MRIPTSWQAEARRMRTQGKASDEIAVLLGKTPSAARKVLRGRPRPPPPILGARADLVEPHVARTPRVVLDRAGLQEAALAFAAGEIDRLELMRRISR
jgi:predicted transcriptional regulator